MRLFGHPVHAMLVHFPSALLPADLVFSLLSFFYHEPLLNYAGYYCMIGGVVTGFFALITGFIDLTSIPSTKKKAISSAFIHGGINGTVILVYSVLAYKAWQTYPEIPSVATNLIIIKAILIFTLFAGNFFGGRLIYHFRIGINEKS